MDAPPTTTPEEDSLARAKARRRRHVFLWVEAAVLALLVGAACARGWLIRKAESMFRERIASALSRDFDSQVVIDSLHVSLAHGVTVQGDGLHVREAADGALPQPDLVVVRHWEFRTTIGGLLATPLHLNSLRLRGMTVDIPMPGHRSQVHRLGTTGGNSKLTIDQLVCEDALLLMEREPDETGKTQPSLSFEVHRLELDGVDGSKPFRFDLRVGNPKPPGEIHAYGKLGPWRAGAVGQTQMEGSYSFKDADLGVFHGIGGTLSSRGTFSGQLDGVEVQGWTDAPDFNFTISGNQVPLRTDFRAKVDGTTGDTRLESVRAKMVRSSFSATGTIQRVMQVPGDPHSKIVGHDIELDGEMPSGRVEDLLLAGVGGKPQMTGGVRMRLHVSVQPGQGTAMERMRLSRGWMRVEGGQMTDPATQKKVDVMSLRTLEGAKKALATQNPANVASVAEGKFTMARKVGDFSQLSYAIPGTRVYLTGQYDFVSKKFEFHGRALLDATASQVTTGWKSFLLKPFNSLFQKKGAATDIPVKISGVRSDLNWQLDYGHDAPEK